MVLQCAFRSICSAASPSVSTAGRYRGPTGDATVTICHKYTKDLASFTRSADILLVAVGKPGLVTADMVKPGAVVIDIGTTRVEGPEYPKGWAIKGDVDFKNVAPKVSYITPVPGGVGPMTIASLLLNTLRAAELRNP